VKLNSRYYAPDVASCLYDLKNGLLGYAVGTLDGDEVCLVLETRVWSTPRRKNLDPLLLCRLVSSRGVDGWTYGRSLEVVVPAPVDPEYLE